MSQARSNLRERPDESPASGLARPDGDKTTSAPTADSELLADALRLYDQGRLSEAAPLFQQVLRRQPNHPLSLHRLGMIARHLGMLDRAIRLLRRALGGGGQSPDLLNDLGRLYVESQDLENARRCFQRCIDHYPRCGLGYVSLAYLENLGGQFDRAESLYLAAADKADQTFEAEFNLATLYRQWGHLDDAVRLYEKLIAAQPNYPPLADGLARALLQQRNWHRGWQAYEARLELEDEPAMINLDLPFPRWHGQSLSGKHLLILHEQGIGDEVQFASCYADVISSADRCTITCSPRLHSIFRRAFPAATLLPLAAADRQTCQPHRDSSFDYFVPAGSLPRFLRSKESEFSGEPYLRSSIRSSGETDNRPGAADRPLRVGVSWWGGAVAEQIRRRSVPLPTFAELFGVAEIQFVNLQHGCCDAASMAELSRFKNLRTYPIDPYCELEPWLDLIASLDLVISVDNSNVHFAGALGVPTWLLLSEQANWRWPAEPRCKSGNGEIAAEVPWYASVKLIRKPAHQDWSVTMGRVCAQLAAV